MSIMCKCGCENSDSALHCENCGEKLGFQKQENNPYQNTPYGGQYGNYQPQQPYYQPNYAQAEQPVSIGAWVGLLFLFSIPIVNIISYIVILCSSQNKTLKNFVLAHFVIVAIAFVLTFLCILIPSLIGYTSRYGILML